jgi:hypothetical protein
MSNSCDLEQILALHRRSSCSRTQSTILTVVASTLLNNHSFLSRQRHNAIRITSTKFISKSIYENKQEIIRQVRKPYPAGQRSAKLNGVTKHAWIPHSFAQGWSLTFLLRNHGARVSFGSQSLTPTLGLHWFIKQLVDNRAILWNFKISYIYINLHIDFNLNKI